MSGTLQEHLRHLEEEIAEWRAGDSNALGLQLASERIVGLMCAFKMTKSEAQIALALADAPGRCFTPDFLRALTRSTDCKANIIPVWISNARRKAQVTITNHFGVGWSMGPESAVKILGAIGPN